MNTQSGEFAQCVRRFGRPRGGEGVGVGEQGDGEGEQDGQARSAWDRERDEDAHITACKIGESTGQEVSRTRFFGLEVHRMAASFLSELLAYASRFPLFRLLLPRSLCLLPSSRFSPI